MISILKGKRLCSRNFRSFNPESGIDSIIFEFRKNKFEIFNINPWDVKPYLGCYLNREQVLNLRDWLNQCLQDTRNDCCYDVIIPNGFKGIFTCPICHTKKEIK